MTKWHAGLSRDHVRNFLSALHECLNHAVEDGHIPVNPAARTSRLLYVRKEEKRSRIVFLDPEEEARSPVGAVQEASYALPGHPSCLGTLLALDCRIGEGCACTVGRLRPRSPMR